MAFLQLVTDAGDRVGVNTDAIALVQATPSSVTVGSVATVTVTWRDEHMHRTHPRVFRGTVNDVMGQILTAERAAHDHPAGEWHQSSQFTVGERLHNGG